MERALVWSAKKLRPQRGWLPLLILLGALVPLPAALSSEATSLHSGVAMASPAPPGSLLIAHTLLAAVTALVLARTKVSEGPALALGLAFGGFFAFSIVGQLVPPTSFLWSEVRLVVKWVGLLRSGTLSWPLPFSASLGYLWTRLSVLGLELRWDAESLLGGASLLDSQAFWLAVIWILWTLGFAASWHVYRRRSPFHGLWPTGLALTLVAFLRPDLSLYLLAFLFCLLWLLAISRLWSRRDYWDRIGTDYPDSVVSEQILTAAPWVILFVLLAGLFPVRGFYKLSGAFWDQYQRVFGPSNEGDVDSYGAGLPRSHLLGGGSEWAETVVFYVETNDAPPPLPGTEALDSDRLAAPPTRYWRGRTMDIYTGQGWASSPTQPTDLYANQPLPQVLASIDPGAFTLRQRFDLEADTHPILYGANAPMRVDRPVQAWWRAPGDLAWLTTNAQRYTVFSQPPSPEAIEMREASNAVPPALVERYLALPDSVPRRVEDLALQVAGDSATRYDQARNIERFLRTYTYTLDLPAPPTDRDLVDYFLFELQAGYCDYYASAMVVMARAVGVPARFVTGYARGEYDYSSERWIVSEENGHSWVEVYFDGIGWVEFEPTAGLPDLERVGDGHSAHVGTPPIPSRNSSWLRRVPLQSLAIGASLAVCLATILVGVRRRCSRRGTDGGPAALVQDRYDRLVRWGARLRRPLKNGLTASEYVEYLSVSLASEAEGSRWSRVRQAGAEVGPDMEQLTEVFLRAQYGPRPPSEHEASQARIVWTRLRRLFWWLKLGQR